MTHVTNHALHPPGYSCFPPSYQYAICNKIKWSTLSIGTALLIIIVYLSSGLHALADITTTASKQLYNNGSNQILWPIASSSLVTVYSWASVSIYFSVVLLVILLLSGIQLKRPCLLFLWSIIMVFMLLADGIMTVLWLRELEQQNYRPTKQIKLLFFAMIVRLIVLLCGIFITIFYFRRLNKIQSEEIDRQRMLELYHKGTPSPSYHDSWAHAAPFAISPRDAEDRYINDSAPVTLPRAKVITSPTRPTATMYHSYNPQSPYFSQFEQRIVKKYNDDFRYNIPLSERFQQREMNRVEEYY